MGRLLGETDGETDGESAGETVGLGGKADIVWTPRGAHVDSWSLRGLDTCLYLQTVDVYTTTVEVEWRVDAKNSAINLITWVILFNLIILFNQVILFFLFISSS